MKFFQTFLKQIKKAKFFELAQKGKHEENFKHFQKFSKMFPCFLFSLTHPILGQPENQNTPTHTQKQNFGNKGFKNEIYLIKIYLFI